MLKIFYIKKYCLASSVFFNAFTNYNFSDTRFLFIVENSEDIYFCLVSCNSEKYMENRSSFRFPLGKRLQDETQIYLEKSIAYTSAPSRLHMLNSSIRLHKRDMPYVCLRYDVSRIRGRTFEINYPTYPVQKHERITFPNIFQLFREDASRI